MIKLTNILNELSINKPIFRLDQIVDTEKHWWSRDVKNPTTFLRDLKSLSNNTRIGFLDKIYGKGQYCLYSTTPNTII